MARDGEIRSDVLRHAGPPKSRASTAKWVQ
jgi:hypothetical protein